MAAGFVITGDEHVLWHVPGPERSSSVRSADGLANLFLALIAAAPLPAGAESFTIAVSPSRLEVPLTGKPTTHTLKVINYGTAPTTLDVRIANFDLDENNKVREIAPKPDSLDQWIIVRPLSLDIPAGETRTIRFAIRPLSRPRPGEHRAMIYLRQDARRLDAGPGEIKIAYQLGVAVYGYAGEKRVATSVHAVEADDRAVAVDMESKGNALSRLRARYAVWPADEAPAPSTAARLISELKLRPDTPLAPPPGAVSVGMMPELPVLPGTRRRLAAPWPSPLAPGSYVVVITGRAGEKTLLKSIPFSVGRS